MAIAQGNLVKFAYTSGAELPATVDDSTVYFLAGATPPAIYVGNTKVASVDDRSWNSVTLGRTASTPGDSVTTWYMPYADSIDSGTMHYIPVKRSGTVGTGIPAYNTDGRLVSVTPNSNDNSTLVATTAFVNAAISGIVDENTTYTIEQDTQDATTFTLTGSNGYSNTITIPVPTKLSDLDNDVGYITGGTATFTGTPTNISVEGIPSGTVEVVVTENSEGNYTPSGSVSVTPSVTMDTTTVNSIESVGELPSYTLPDLTFRPSDGNLSISWDAGTFLAGSLPTQGEDTVVATGVNSATASGTFSGTPVQVSGRFSGDGMTATGRYTPEGTVDFTGTN